VPGPMKLARGGLAGKNGASLRRLSFSRSWLARVF